MHASAPIAQGLVYDINAPHASGLRESKHAYGRSSAPIAQGLVYDIHDDEIEAVKDELNKV